MVRKAKKARGKRKIKSVRSRGFSNKGTGVLAGGGQFVFRVKTVSQALTILKRLKRNIAFWQVSRKVTIKLPKRRKRTVDGFSQARKRNQISATQIQRALRDCLINAINSIGGDFKYEGAIPDFIKPKTRDFLLLVWFDRKHRQSILKKIG